MPSYLWPMTSPLPVFFGYRLVMFGPFACFTSVYIQNLPTAHAFAAAWGFFCTFCRLSLTSYGVSYFLIPHSLWLAPFGAGLGFAWLWAFLLSVHSFALFYSFAFPVALFCHSCYVVIWPKLARLLWAYCLFFSQWLSMVIGLFVTLLAGSCVSFSFRHPLPIYFPWASLTLSNLVFPWALTNSFELP